jgi:hypothetical protein
VLPQFLQRSFYWYPFLAPFCLCVALLAAAAVKHRWIAAALVALELIAVGSGRPMNTQSLKREPGIGEAQIDGSPESLATVRRIAAGGRIDTINDSALWSSGAPIARLRSANGYDPLALEHLIQVRLKMAKGARWGAFYQIEKPDAEALRALAVTAIVTRQPVQSPLLDKAAEIPGRLVYRVREPAPRLEFAGTMSVLRDERNEIHLELNHAAPAQLIARDAWSSLWRATLDGKPVPLLRRLGAFRAVEIPPGHHQVTMEIDHWRFWRWSLLSIAALAAMLLTRRPWAGNTGQRQ